MGGMGVWEVGARMSDTFAAIAPVAGHHKAEVSEHAALGSTRQVGDAGEGQREVPTKGQ